MSFGVIADDVSRNKSGVNGGKIEEDIRCCGFTILFGFTCVFVCRVECVLIGGYLLDWSVPYVLRYVGYYSLTLKTKHFSQQDQYNTLVEEENVGSDLRQASSMDT